jgi:hypothetical protein
MERLLTIITVLIFVCVCFLGAITVKQYQGDIASVKIARQEQRVAEKQAEVQATTVAESVPFCIRLKTIDSESTDCVAPEDGVVDISLPGSQGQILNFELDLKDNTAEVEVVSPGVFPPSE